MKSTLGMGFLALASLVPLSARADQWNKHWSVSAMPELRIHAGDAAVTVIGGNGSGIDANLTTRGWHIGSDGVQVTEHQMGNVVEIDVKVPSSHFSWGNREIRLEVHVPKEITGDVHTGDGSIDLRDLHGSLRVDTGDGSIHGENLDGSLNAVSGDGSVHIRGRFDSLQLRTSDGSVELTAEEGSRVKSDWQVQTGDGSVRVSLPHDLAADLELHTGDGSINLSVSTLTGSEMKNGHDVRGKLNGGGSVLMIHTGDGSISLSS